jgi:hypothetical protein
MIDDDPCGRGVGPDGDCTQRVETCFLLVAEPVVEFGERGLHGSAARMRNGVDAQRFIDLRFLFHWEEGHEKA